MFPQAATGVERLSETGRTNKPFMIRFVVFAESYSAGHAKSPDKSAMRITFRRSGDWTDDAVSTVRVQIKFVTDVQGACRSWKL